MGQNSSVIPSQEEMLFFPSEEQQGTQVASLKEKHVGIVFGGGIASSLIHHLGQMGIGKLTLFADKAITLLDIQHSKHLRPEDELLDVGDVIGKRFENQDTVIEVQNRPKSMVQWQSLTPKLDLVVAPIDGPVLFHPWINHLNSACLQSQTPFFTGSLLDGKEPHIGPFFVPDKTACFSCFEYRYKSNISQFEAYEAFESFIHNQDSFVDFGVFPPMVEMIGSFMAHEVKSYLLGREPKTLGRLATFNTSNMSLMFHPVLKIPRCPTCSPV